MFKFEFRWGEFKLLMKPDNYDDDAKFSDFFSSSYNNNNISRRLGKINEIKFMREGTSWRVFTSSRAYHALKTLQIEERKTIFCLKIFGMAYQ